MDRFWKYKLDHWIFWAITIFFHAFTRLYLIGQAGAGEFAAEVVVRNALLAAVIYLNLLVLVPRLAGQGKYAAYVISLLAGLLAYAAIKNAHDVHLFGSVLHDPARSHFLQNTFYNLSIALFYVAFSVGLHLSKEWYFQRALIRKIEIEKLNTELDYLKAQINPHFLFNSINTIYFQIEKGNTLARETLVTFSEMLRYQLYECNGHEIPVDKEVQYLKHYTDLQRLRKDENYKITFSAAPEVGNFTVAPLLLIPFVENAFKHVSHFADRDNEICIQMSCTGDYFELKVFNTRDQKSSGPGGIGLKNVKRRLELLYPGRHSLTVRNTETEYEVNLQLQIK